MAVPNTNTFKLRDVYSELQISTFGVGLRNAFNRAPNISYDPLYKGSEDRLTNFRDYVLITGWTSAVSSQPRGIAYDGTNAWIANYSLNSVSKITPSGVMTTYSSTGTNPIAIAYDGANMWTANIGDASVSKITPTGTITTYAGVGSQPMGIAYDGANMWTTNTNNKSVSKITSTGTITTYINASYNVVGAITFDGTNMWVGIQHPFVSSSNGVAKVTPAGVFTNYISAGITTQIDALKYASGNIWAAHDCLSKITTAGVFTNYTQIIASTPHGLSYDGSTYLWTAGGTQIQKYGLDGTFVFAYSIPSYAYGTVFGGDYVWIGNTTTNCVSRIGVV